MVAVVQRRVLVLHALCIAALWVSASGQEGAFQFWGLGRKSTQVMQQQAPWHERLRAAVRVAEVQRPAIPLWMVPQLPVSATAHATALMVLAEWPWQYATGAQTCEGHPSCYLARACNSERAYPSGLTTQESRVAFRLPEQKGWWCADTPRKSHALDLLEPSRAAAKVQRRLS